MTEAIYTEEELEELAENICEGKDSMYDDVLSSLLEVSGQYEAIVDGLESMIDYYVRKIRQLEDELWHRNDVIGELQNGRRAVA